VTPAPRRLHQRAVGELFYQLRGLVPDDLDVLLAPFDVRLNRTDSLQPDVLVARRRDVTDANLPVPPLLAIEVLSPSTRHIDLGLKPSKYEALGTPSYWVMDPYEPSISIWELAAGRYLEVGRAVGEEALAVQRPFAVQLVPRGLVS
jgi:Uma2 family endonuclease